MKPVQVVNAVSIHVVFMKQLNLYNKDTMGTTDSSPVYT